MPDASDHSLLAALLDSWDRNNTILVNLLRALPEGTLDLRPLDDSPSIAQMMIHMHYCRLVFVLEATPEFAREMPRDEWNAASADVASVAAMLNESAAAVREAVKNRLETGRETAAHYDHPILFLQHFIWHEGYHHGQIKLALKRAGRAFDDEEIGAVTWDVWMKKTYR